MLILKVIMEQLCFMVEFIKERNYKLRIVKRVKQKSCVCVSPFGLL